MQRTMYTLWESCILPLLPASNPEIAVDYVESLKSSGVFCAELSATQVNAFRSAERILHYHSDFCIGVGKIVSTGQLEQAVSAGAQFLILDNPLILEATTQLQIPVFVQQGNGRSILCIDSSSIPSYGSVLPTTTVAAHDFSQLFVDRSILALRCQDFFSHIPQGGASLSQSLCDAAEAAITSALGFRLAHIGINCADSDVALQIASAFRSLFGFPIKDGPTSYFAGTAIEAMKQPYLGKLGHIAIFTSSIDRAVAVLSRRGFTFDESTRKQRDGKTTAIYLADEIGGFAVHLVQAMA